jgi:glycosyltransferase involved in cell wall biosynthesis
MARVWKKLQAFREPIREVEKNLFVLNPLAIPAYGWNLVRQTNQWWLKSQIVRAMRRLRFQRPISWIFNPAAAILAGALNEEILIYQCVDEYSAFSGVHAASILTLEERLLSLADLVIVSAEPLRQSKCKSNPNTVLVRHGVDYTHFRRALDAETIIPEEVARLPRPIIGFFGLIADWVDTELMAKIANKYPQGSLVVLGKATTDTSCLALPNVHLLGRKPYEALPAYCKGFDIAINPFRINELTINANPLKVREYLAAGLPVVSTDIPEVAALGWCRLANNHEQFIREVEQALQTPGPQQEISELVRAEGWESRVEEIDTHLGALARTHAM